MTILTAKSKRTKSFKSITTVIKVEKCYLTIRKQCKKNGSSIRPHATDVGSDFIDSTRFEQS